jgi:hypothetical protein
LFHAGATRIFIEAGRRLISAAGAPRITQTRRMAEEKLTDTPFNGIRRRFG